MKFPKRFFSFITGVLLIILVLWISGLNTVLFHSHWHMFSSAPLDRIERELNEAYQSSRPFLYRWPGVPYGTFSLGSRTPRLDEVLARLDRIELQLGRNTRTLRLHGRADLLLGNYGDAITKYRSALFLDEGNAELQLELGVALALRAGTGISTLDDEFALEAILEAREHLKSTEALYDSALLFEAIPLPGRARDEWTKVIATEQVAGWRKEAESRLRVLEQHDDQRERLQHELTDSPDSFLTHAKSATGVPEVVLNTALEEWLPADRGPGTIHTALSILADLLKTERHDWWLSDFLARHSRTGGTATHALSEAVKANSEGEHIRAEHFASQAKHLFHEAGDTAGFLRARVELVYSFDRQWRHTECLKELNGLADEAGKKRYVWIGAQAKLEEIACRTETRRADVISDRTETAEWVKQTHYDDLWLRALSFLTEEYGGYDSRRQVWATGLQGLRVFWAKPLPERRGYTFYYTLARSSWNAGDKKAAMTLLDEGIDILQRNRYRQLFALALSDKAAWLAKSGLNTAARITFDDMEALFAKFGHLESKKFWRQAEITYAEVETAQGRPKAALARLEQVTSGQPFPYADFGPTERRRLLPVLGNAYLAAGELAKASKCYRQIISEHRRDIQSVHSHAQRGNAQREIEPAWRGLVEVALRQGRSSNALYIWEAFRAGRLQDPRPKKLQPPPGTTFFVYAFLPGGLSAWSVDYHGVQHRWLDEKAASGAARQLSSLAADPDSRIAAVTTAAQNAYATLIQPLSPCLPAAGQLVIDADGPLGGIPWMALEDADGSALIEHFAVSQTIGWGPVASLIHQTTVDFTAPLVVAEPKLLGKIASDFPPPPGLHRQLQYLRKKMPAGAFFQGPDATLRTLADHLPESTLLHFGGHGISYGEFGALLLASSDDKDGRFVTSEEISGMSLRHLSLVVLAACSSGTGEQSGTANPDSLVRGFLDGGASRVIAARWNVSSPETSDLIIDFYERMLNHESPANALSAAALQIRKDPRTSHPYYWAGFQVFGTP